MDSLTTLKAAVLSPLTIALTDGRGAVGLPDSIPVGAEGFPVVLDGEDDAVVETATAGASAWQTVRLLVRFYLGRTNELVSQALADRYRTPTGPTSVKALIEGDRTLGGQAHYVMVGPPSALGTAPVGAVDYLIVDWPVEVTA